MSTLLIFAALQAADLVTTLAFLKAGVAEANPLVMALIHALGQPAPAVLLVKVAGCLMAYYAWRTQRFRLLRRANVFFALCAAWNLLAMASL
ncbi:MAG: DUF5658 family protein [Candidatus Solibacter sp.]